MGGIFSTISDINLWIAETRALLVGTDTRREDTGKRVDWKPLCLLKLFRLQKIPVNLIYGYAILATV